MKILSVMSFVLAVVVNLLAISTVAANDVKQGIEVRGNANVAVEANEFILTVTIAEIGNVTSKLKTVVDHKSQLVVNLAKKAGVKNKNINSARINLKVIDKKPSIRLNAVEVQTSFGHKSGSIYASPNSQPIPIKNPPLQFELSRLIILNFTDIASYDRFLQAVVKVGVQRISPVNMTVADSESHYQQALLLAITNAKEKASKIAVQMNVDLGQLLYLAETSINRYKPIYRATSRASYSDNSFSSSAGETVISASVIIKYAIVPK